MIAHVWEALLGGKCGAYELILLFALREFAESTCLSGVC